MNAAGPNAEQITYWNETAGPKWVALEEMLDAQIRGLGEVAMDRVADRPRRARARRRLRHAARRASSWRVASGRAGGSAAWTSPRPCSIGRASGRDRPEPTTSPSSEPTRRRTASSRPPSTSASRASASCSSPIRSRRSRTSAARSARAGDSASSAGRRCPRTRGCSFRPWRRRSTSRCRCRRRPTRRAPSRSPTPIACATSSSAPASPTSGFDDHRTTLTVGGRGGLDRAVDFMLQMGPLGRGAAGSHPGAARHGRCRGA